MIYLALCTNKRLTQKDDLGRGEETSVDVNRGEADIRVDADKDLMAWATQGNCL